jgi:Flp pilus assembly protein TadD
LLRQAQVESTPGDWQAWYRLAIAYGDARDTARGRRTMRKAIAMQRALIDPAVAPTPNLSLPPTENDK